MIFALSHFAQLALLGLVFLSTGYSLQRVVPGLRVNELGQLTVCLTLGLVSWMQLLLLLAFAGLYRSGVVFALAASALLTAAGLWLHSRWKRGSRAELPKLALAPAAVGVVLALPIFATGAAVLFRCLTPDVGWDDNVYHLTLPKLYLTHGGFRYVPFNVYSNWPHAVELIFGMAMMLRDYLLAKLVHAGFTLAMLFAVYRVCRAHGSAVTALAAVLLTVSNEVVLFEATVAYVDIACAFFFLVAVASADAYSNGRSRGALVLSGLACAALAASKLSGIAGAACIAAWLLWLRVSRKQAFDARGWLVETAVVVGPALLALAAWSAKSYLYTGNPLYPLFYGTFAGPEWSAELGRSFASWQRNIGAGRGWLDYLLLPYRVATIGGGTYDRFGAAVSSFWLAAVPFAALAARYVKASRSYLACAGLYFGFWAVTSQQMRFLIPILPLLAIATALCVEWVCARVDVPPARQWLRVGFYAAVLLVSVEPLFPTWTLARADLTRLGRDEPVDLYALAGEGYRFVNEHTAPEARLMLLHTNLGFYLDREYIADSFFEASQMKWLVSQAHTKQELRALLRERGVTHVYADRDRWGIGFPKLLDELLNDPQSVKQLHTCRAGDCRIYQLL